MMRTRFWILSSVAAVSLGFTDVPSRLDLDHRAKQAFLGLNFFAEGRGMHLIPGLIEFFSDHYKTPLGLGLRDQVLKNHWGFNLQDHWPVGLFDVPYKEMHVGVLGCVACHSGRAAGQLIVGLGNKNIDVVQIGKDSFVIEKIYNGLHPESHSEEYETVRDSALEFAKLLSNEKWGNTTQGMVPVSFIRSWFYKQAGFDVPQNMSRGAVKIPSLWGYGEKRTVGQFSDGYGNGNLPGWAIAVELTAGQTPETVRTYLPEVEKAEDLFSHFLPPPYPFAVDRTLAIQGKGVFLKTCSGCHGSYDVDDQGWPQFKAPNWVPWTVVKTDSDREEANTPQFDQLVENSPLHDILQHTRLGKGFFAPRLVGIWCRFPYLHNGSVPTLAALLTPQDDRPQNFSVRNAGEEYRFDQINVGLTDFSDIVTQDFSPEDFMFWKRTQYNTREVGHSNSGHDFGTSLRPDEKLALIEYLKTL